MDNLPADIPALIALIDQNQAQILSFIEGFCSGGVATIFFSLLLRWMAESDYAFATYEADLLQQELLTIGQLQGYEQIHSLSLTRQLKVAMAKAYRHRKTLTLTKGLYWVATISTLSVGFVGLLIKYGL